MSCEVDWFAQIILAIGIAWFLYWFGKAIYVKAGGTTSGKSSPIISMKSTTNKPTPKQEIVKK